MKKVVAINGSPRKNGNTVILLQRALEGAASTGAETTLVNLCDLNYRGCISCFSCKRKDNSLHGRCAMRDGLSPVLDQVVGSDVLFLGTPIYVNNITGAMQSFLERLVFMNLSYDNIEESYFKGRMNRRNTSLIAVAMIKYRLLAFFEASKVEESAPMRWSAL